MASRPEAHISVWTLKDGRAFGLEAIAVKTGRDWLLVRIPKRDPRKPVGRPKGKR